MDPSTYRTIIIGHMLAKLYGEKDHGLYSNLEWMVLDLFEKQREKKNSY